MRPASANKNNHLVNSRKRPSTANKKREAQAQDKYQSSFVTENEKEYFSKDGSGKKKDKIVFCESAKKIAMIHAYQPKLLKKCLVVNPKSYKQFYYQNEGLCMINNLYTISFMAHFRQWRKNIQTQFSKVIKSLLCFDPLVGTQQVNKALKHIQNLSDELISASKAVSSQKQLKLSQQAHKLSQSFAALSNFIEKLINILKIFCETVMEISSTLQQAFDSKIDAKSAKQIIKKSYSRFESATFQSIGKCQCQPESGIVNRAEFIIKDHLKQMYNESIDVLKKIKDLNNFKKKLHQVSEVQGKSDEQVLKVLQETSKMIKTHQNYRPKIRKQSQSKENKFQQMKAKLQQKFNSIILEFLVAFKQKLQPILQNQYNQIKNQNVETCMNQQNKRYNRFHNCCQKFKHLTIIFNKTLAPQINQRLSHMTSKESAKTIDQIIQIISSFRQLSNRPQISSRLVVFQRINQLSNNIYDFQQRKDRICEIIRSCLIYKDSVQVPTVQQKKQLNHLKSLQKKIFLITDHTLSQLLKVNRKPHLQKLQRRLIEQEINKDRKTIESTITQKFGDIQNSANDLTNLINDPMIGKFIKFSEEIKKDSIYSFWIFMQFYDKMFKNENIERQLTKDSLIKMFNFYQEYLSKCENYRNSRQSMKFLQWIFETLIMLKVLNSTKTIDCIIQSASNKKRPSNTLPNSTELEKLKQILSYLVSFSNRELHYIRKGSTNQKYISRIVNKIEQINIRQHTAKLLQDSEKLGTLFPTAKSLQQWLRCEFNYAFDENEPEQAVRKQRKNISQILNKNLKNIHEIQTGKHSALLESSILQKCKDKAKSIKDFLLPYASSSNFEKDKLSHYTELASSLLGYLRANKIYHVGLFTNNQNSYTFYLEGDPASFVQFLQMFEKDTKLPQQIQKQSASQRFVQFEISQKKIDKISSKQQKKQEKPVFVLGKEKKKMLDQPAFILDENEMEQQIVEQNDGFVLGSVSKIKQSLSEINSPEKSTIQTKKHVYYKFKQIQSLNYLKNALKSMRSQPQTIKKLLNFAKLSLALDQKQPNKQLTDHLNQILSSLKSNNLMQKLNKKNKMSQSQKIIQNLLESVQNSDRKDKIIQSLQQVLKTIDYSLKVLYDQGTNGNKIIVCTNNLTQQSYAYAILLNQNPDAGIQSVLKDQQMNRIQKLFLNSLFTIPFEKNRNLDQIKKEISSLQLDPNVNLRNNLYVYRKIPVKNMKVVDEKIQKYLKSKIKEVKITNPNVINFDSYQNFEKQYFQLIKACGQEDSIQTIYLNSAKNFPIFYSKDKQQLKNILLTSKDGKKVYSIVPSRFTNFPYVERSNFQRTDINLSKITKHIIDNELQNSQSVNPEYILQFISESNSSQNINSQRQNVIVFDPSNLQDYSIVSNTIKAVGENQPISEIINELKKQNKSEEDLQDILKEKPAFILSKGSNYSSLQQEHQFMKPEAQSEQAVFIIEDNHKKNIYSPETLQKLALILAKKNFSHRKVTYKNVVIGLASSEEQPLDIIKNIMLLENDQIVKYNQSKQKNIEINELSFKIKIRQQICSNFAQDKRIIQILDNYEIQISNGKTIKKISNIRSCLGKQIIVQCDFPKNPIQIKLIKKLKAKSGLPGSAQFVFEKCLKNYKYGNSYNLIRFEDYFIERFEEQKRRLQQQQEQQKTNEKVRAQQQKVTKRQTVLERVKSQQYDSEEQIQQNQCIGDFSFTLSDNYQIDAI